MFKHFFQLFYKRKPTVRELDWRGFKIGREITYLGVKGVVVFNHDLYETKVEGDDFEGEAFITMRYVDNSGRFAEVDLVEVDLYGDVEEV